MYKINITLLLFLLALANYKVYAETFPATINVEYQRSLSSNQIALDNNTSIIITVRFTNNENFDLKGLFLSEQIPNGIHVENESVTVGGIAINTLTLETGNANSVYSGYTPYYWILGSSLEDPSNSLAGGQTVEITYSLSGGTPGTYPLSQDGFFGIYNEIPNAFYCYEDQLTNITVVSVTSLTSEIKNIEDFNLLKAYPNPFNPVINIEFSLNAPKNTRLDLFNSTGQFIKSLHAGFLPVGFYSFKWDGKDQNGSGVSSGVYFCRLTAEEKVVQVKQLFYTR